MGSLEKAVEAADGPWPVIAIAIIGLYLLMWKFGSQLLLVARENNGLAKGAVTTATKAHEQIKAVSEQIVTNHGSKHIGDSIDRLTEWMLIHLEESRNNDEQLHEVRREFVQHIAQTDIDREAIRRALTEMDDRLGHLETQKDKRKGA